MMLKSFSVYYFNYFNIFTILDTWRNIGVLLHIFTGRWPPHTSRLLEKRLFYFCEIACKLSYYCYFLHLIYIAMLSVIS